MNTLTKVKNSTPEKKPFKEKNTLGSKSLGFISNVLGVVQRSLSRLIPRIQVSYWVEGEGEESLDLVGEMETDLF